MDAIKESYFGWSISRSAVAGTELISVVATSLPDGVQVELAPESFSHPPQSAVGGVLCHAVLSESRWLRLNSVVQYRSSDILIVSYPKCGTTWLEQCVLLLLNGGDKALLNPGNKNVYSPLMPDRGGKIWLEACIHEDPQVFAVREAQ